MLHRQVMILTRTRIEGTWKAYCFPVPGINHDNEEHFWETEGAQLSEEHARYYFHDSFWDNLPYAD